MGYGAVKKNRKCTVSIAIIVSTILALIIAAFLMFTSSNESKPDHTVIPKKDTVSSKTIVKEDPAISEDSVKREWVREIEQEREGYTKEQASFAEVLKEASDEELFIVLNYAMANHYGAIKCYKSSTNSLRKKQAKRETSNDIAV